MECSNCKTEMEEGYLYGYQLLVSWVKKKTGWLKLLFGKKAKDILAWNCPTCGKIELITKGKK